MLMMCWCRGQGGSDWAWEDAFVMVISVEKIARQQSLASAAGLTVLPTPGHTLLVCTLVGLE